MMHPDDLFAPLIRPSEEGVAVWTLPTDFPYFDGHFPGMPVFPAVGILDASWYFLKQISPELSMYNVTSAKFSKPIGPGQRVRMQAQGQTVDWYDANSRELLATLKLEAR